MFDIWVLQNFCSATKMSSSHIHSGSNNKALNCISMAGFS